MPKSLPLLIATTLVASAPLFAQQVPGPSSAPSPHTEAGADLEQQLDLARERLNAAARDVAELSAKLGYDVAQRFRPPGFPPRAVIGVQIEAHGPAGGGAKVAAVSPGGPAAVAGIEPGDLITAIDSVDLAKSPEPARALVERMRDLAPGSKVTLKVQHAGKSREVVVEPRPAPPMMAGGPPGAQGPLEGPMHRGGGMPGGAGMAGAPPGMGPGSERPWMGGPEARHGEFWGPGGERAERGPELATLSARLGGYFGVKAGALVVRAGESPFKLEDGDVITAIDAREITSARQAERILRSYGQGEKLAIKVLRDHKPVTIEVVIAEREGRA